MRYFPTYQAYRNAWNDAHHKDPKIPLNLDIELSSICNLKCKFCYYTNPKFKRSAVHFFPVYELNKLIIKANKLGIPAIKLNWIGEPTLHPFFNLILQGISRYDFYDVIVNTNGNYKSNINKGLMCATKVIFSLDSFHCNLYAKSRKGGKFSIVMDNIRDLLDRGYKNIIVRRVITKDNCSEDYMSNALDIFKGEVKTSEHYAYDRNADYKSQVDYPTELGRQYCGYPSQRLIIDTELNVYPCCVDAYKTMRLGNIAKDSLMDIWQSKKLKHIRERLRIDKMPSRTCKNCQSWIAYRHPYSEKVKDREVYAK